jgi:hypothetical protein
LKNWFFHRPNRCPYMSHGENFSKWVDYDKAKGFYVLYLINKWHWCMCVCVCVFWKHIRRFDLTCHWHPQVKLIANKPTWVSFAHHWVWTQDLLWLKGKRNYFWVVGSPGLKLKVKKHNWWEVPILPLNKVTWTPNKQPLLFNSS